MRPLVPLSLAIAALLVGVGQAQFFRGLSNLFSGASNFFSGNQFVDDGTQARISGYNLRVSKRCRRKMERENLLCKS